MSTSRTQWSRILVACAVTDGTLLGGVAVAAPAHAAKSNCPSGYTCTWGDSDFKTAGIDSALVKFQFYIPNYGTWNYAGTGLNAANSANSIYNHGVSETSSLYSGTSKTGFLFSIPIGNSNSNLWWQGAQNDNIESGYYASYNLPNQDPQICSPEQ